MSERRRKWSLFSLFMKLKPLIPSLRERKRYLVFEIISDKKMSFKDVEGSIEDASLGFFGSLGFAKSGMRLLPEYYRDNRGILVINHDTLDLVRSALLTISEVNGNKTSVITRGVSGILKKAKAKYLEKEAK